MTLRPAAVTAPLIAVYYPDYNGLLAVQTLLRLEGFRSTGAMRAERILEDAASFAFDLIVIRSTIDGLALLTKLHNLGSVLPIILLTAPGDPMPVARAGRMVSAGLTVPIDAENLIASVRRLLSAQEASRR